MNESEKKECRKALQEAVRHAAQVQTMAAECYEDWGHACCIHATRCYESALVARKYSSFAAEAAYLAVRAAKTAADAMDEMVRYYTPRSDDTIDMGNIEMQAHHMREFLRMVRAEFLDG